MTKLEQRLWVAVGYIAGTTYIALIGSVMLALPVLILWNAVLPDLFPGIGSLTLGRAWGLVFLCALLFKNNAIQGMK